MNGHGEWTRLASSGGGMACLPKGREESPPGVTRNIAPRDYVSRIALLHIHQRAHMPWILAEARCWAGWVWVGGIRCGRALMPSRESRSATCSSYMAGCHAPVGGCLKGEDNGIGLRFLVRRGTVDHPR